MRLVIVALIVVGAAGGAAQQASGLGDDPARFDQRLETALAGRDIAFLQAAAADDMRFTNGGTVWNKQQFVDAVRVTPGLERTVDDVQVEQHGDLVETVGRLRTVTSGPSPSESWIDFVRLYRRGPRGWQLVSHRTVRERSEAMPTVADANPQGPPRVPPVATGSGLGPAAPPTEPGVFRPGNGVTLPRMLHDAKPQYTSEAMKKRIQGMVVLECVVDTDGTVRNVKVVRSLDALYGLDEQAIQAAKQWRFEPGTRNGQPVPVMITIEMAFTLGK